MNIDCSASLRNWWQSHYQVVDLKEKSTFDFRVTAQSVYEQYCLGNGNHYSFEVFKPETMQLGTGIICQGEEVERTMTIVTIMSCQLIL